jgi:hypothetical protein
MDFEHSLAGWAESKGCALTQTGVLCQEADSLDLRNALSSTGTSTMSYNNGPMFNVQYKGVGPARADLVKWLLGRDYKYELGAGGHTTEAHQDGRDNPENFKDAWEIKITTFASNYIGKRFPALSLAENTQDLCADGMCFWTPFVQFVDPAGEPI